MTSDDAAPQSGDFTAGTTGPLPFDTSVAHQARMYDYVLGGKDDYAADRAAAEAGLKVWPDMALLASPRSAFDADTAVHPDAVKIRYRWPLRPP